MDESSRPDLVLSDPERLVYVEIKHDSPLGDRQLETYWDLLQEKSRALTRLCLLTRSRASAHDTTLARDRFNHVCWHEVHRQLHGAQVDEPASAYLRDAFIELLELKRMSLKRVGWEYIAGVPGLIDLTDMLWAAIEEAIPDCQLRATSGWGWRGVYVDQDWYCGIRYNLHQTVVFENNQGQQPNLCSKAGTWTRLTSSR